MNKKPLIVLSISLALFMTNCVSENHSPNSVLNINDKSIQKVTSLSGTVEFPSSTTSSTFAVKATVNDISTKAVVSLIYPSDYSNPSLRNLPAATGITNASGQFTINPDISFNPQSGDIFILEASKRVGNTGNDNLSLRTIIRWTGNNWESITAPGIYINSKTTVLAILSGLSPAALPSSVTLNKMNVVNNVTQVSDINSTFTTSLINSIVGKVEALISNNQDPVSYINLRNGEYIIEQRSNTSTLGCVGEPGNCPTPAPSLTPYTVAPIPTPASTVSPGSHLACIGDNISCPTPTSAPTYIGEFRVNTYVTNHQTEPVIAYGPNGDFVIAWSSTSQDGSGDGIYAQRYNSSSVKQGSEFQVNTYTTNAQTTPAITYNSTGDFIITWDSNGQNGNGSEIYAQRYNSLGVTQGPEFRVNTYIASTQNNSAISAGPNGDFVVTWTSDGQDGNGYGVFAKRYNSSGVAQGSEFRVNTYNASTQNKSAIAYNSNGDFVITWSSIQDTNSTTASTGIYAQRYNSSGVAQGSEFRVNTYIIGNQSEPSISAGSNGNFVITWQSSGQDGSANGIYAQRYNSSGVAQGSEFKVNSFNTDNQNLPVIAYSSTDDFSITWQSQGQNSNGYEIYAQRYNSSGVAQGSEFRVNTYITNDQSLPTIAYGPNGDFIITWESFGQDGSVTSSDGIYAKRYNSLGIEQ